MILNEPGRDTYCTHKLSSIVATIVISRDYRYHHCCHYCPCEILSLDVISMFGSFPLTIIIVVCLVVFLLLSLLLLI